MQSIIVYRNPLEAAFWESGLLFPIIVGCIFSFAVVIALGWIFDTYNKASGRGSWGLTVIQSRAIIVSAIIAMIATIWFMM